MGKEWEERKLLRVLEEWKSIMDTKEVIEIAHSSEVLKQVYELMRKANSLIENDRIAKEYINFSASMTWRHDIWDKLNDAYAKAKPNDKSTYYLRAFDYFEIQPGMLINGAPECCKQ